MRHRSRGVSRAVPVATVIVAAMSMAGTLVATGPSHAAEAAGVRTTMPADVDISAASWSEPDWCADRKSLEDLQASYRPATLKATLIEIAKRRYPPGVAVFADAPQKAIAKYLETDLDAEDYSTRSLGWLFSGLVHEMGHEWDGTHRSNGYTYRFFDDRVYRTAAIRTFPRSEILARYPNQSGNVYKRYLGNTGGRDGINGLLEEFVQYVHQLAASQCVTDFPPELVAAEEVPGEYTYLQDRDAVLTFMWYVQTYLAIAREEHPKDYRKIIKARGLRTAILDTWRRAEYWLARTQTAPPGTISAELEQRIREPQNIREIQLLADR